MKKGVFSSWFREFATIIFTQTVQAFLLAIVLSVIVSSLAGSSNGEDSVGAAGLLAIIALSSFGKIEMLVKNIFGVTSAFGDPGSLNAGKGITAGTAMAWKLGSRLTDNMAKSREGKRMIKEGRKGLESLGGKGLNSGDSEGNPDGGSDGGKDGEGNDEQSKNTREETGEKINKEIMRLETMGSIDELTSAIRALTNATNTANKSDAQSKREKYQDMLNEGKNLQRTAFRENVGATIGGIAGGVVGLAKGEDVLQTAIAGAGAGDALGQASAQKTASSQKHKTEMKKLNDQIKNLSEEEYKKGIEALESDLSNLGIASFRPGANVGKELLKNTGRKIASPIKNSTLGNNIQTMHDNYSTKKEMKNKMKNYDKNNDVGKE